MSDGRHDFDFLHGDWTIRNRRLAEALTGCTEWHVFDSVATVRPILHGLGNADTISVHDLPGTPLVGGFVNGRGTFDGTDTLGGTPIAVRFRWDHGDARTAAWRQSFSADGGRTWELNWVMDFERAA